MPGSGKIIALGGGGSGTVTNVTGTAPIVSSGGVTPAISISGVTGEQGNGALLQLSTGTVNSNRVAKFDANGNTINSSITDNGTIVSTSEEIDSGANGTVSGILGLLGSTSGKATLTAPTVAGTVTNSVVATNGFSFASTNTLDWNSDTFLSRNAAANVQLGAASAASPVAQTLGTQGSRAGTDTNVAGANITIQSGNGTGNSTGSSLIFQAPVAVGSGTGAQTQTTALTLTGTAATVAVQQLSANGTAAAPSKAYTSEAALGLFRVSGGIEGHSGSVELTGSLKMIQLATPSAPVITNSGVTGAATWTYKIVAVDDIGGVSVASAGGSTTTGNATLTGSNFNIITWSAVVGAATYQIYRTAVGTSPTTTGLIGTVTSPTLTFNDTGVAGDSAAAPSINTTGAILCTPSNNNAACIYLKTTASTGIALVCSGSSQLQIKNGTMSGNGTLVAQQYLAAGNGNASGPAYVFNSASTTGIFFDSSSNLGLSVGGVQGLSVGSTTLQCSAPNAAAPIAYTIQGQGSRPGTDTDVAGANLTIRSGNGTGAAAGSSLILQAPVAVGSGTGAQTQTTVVTITGTQFDAFTKFQINNSGLVSKYNNISTVGNGLAQPVGVLDLTAQSAAVTATTIYTPTATGRYRISVYEKVTTAASVSSILGGGTGTVLTFTDGTDSVAQSITMGLDNQGGTLAITNNGNSTTTSLNGSAYIYAKTGVAIQLAIGYTSVNNGEMVFAVRATCEAL